MTPRSHRFVEEYDGLIGFGLDRKTDEDTVICYLQMFSDDNLMQTLRSRMTDADLTDIFDFVNRLMKKHLAEDEYHRLFLKDDDHG